MHWQRDGCQQACLTCRDRCVQPLQARHLGPLCVSALPSDCPATAKSNACQPHHPEAELVSLAHHSNSAVQCQRVASAIETDPIRFSGNHTTCDFTCLQLLVPRVSPTWLRCRQHSCANVWATRSALRRSSHQHWQPNHRASVGHPHWLVTCLCTTTVQRPAMSSAGHLPSGEHCAEA